jgi:Protein of unknown function (DUF3047)
MFRIRKILNPRLVLLLFLSGRALLWSTELAFAFAVLENFERYGDAVFPSRWKSRNDEAQKIYRIEAENSNRFLRAHAEKQAVQIGLDYVFNAQKLRRLSWRWRVHQLPAGADERSAEKHDAAAQVYVVFDNQYWPRVIKYIWSAALPAGSRFTNPLYSRGRVAVLRNGEPDKNKWYDEEVNFLDDYRKFFGAEPGQVQGIGILTSSDSTKSVAAADYDDFVLLP